MEARDVDGSAPLHHASVRNRLGHMDVLINRGANLEAKNENGETSLHLICRSSKNHVDNGVHLLLDRGANIEAKNNSGRTPLHVVTGLSASPMLLDEGASLEATDRRFDATLHRACSGHNSSLARLLLNHGADLEATANLGFRPLHFAAVNDFPDVVRLLLNRGAVVLVDAKTFAGMTLLSLACQKEKVEIVWLLVRRCPWLVDWQV